LRIDQLCVRAVVTFVPVVARPGVHLRAISIASLILAEVAAESRGQVSRPAARLLEARLQEARLLSSCMSIRLHFRVAVRVRATLLPICRQLARVAVVKGSVPVVRAKVAVEYNVPADRVKAAVE
jgi:hypothetical protein